MEENVKKDIAKAVVVGAMSEIPIVGGVIAEVIGCLDQRYIEKRLSKLERKNEPVIRGKSHGFIGSASVRLAL